MSKYKHRFGLELVYALSLLLTGLIALPAIVFLVGSRIFGEYSAGAAIMPFFLNFTKDLGEAKLSAWILALGPLILVYAVRAILGHFSFGTEPSDTTSQPKRIEPAIR